MFCFCFMNDEIRPDKVVSLMECKNIVIIFSHDFFKCGEDLRKMGFSFVF